MALVESVDIPLGTKMPPFVLPDPNGSLHDGTKLYGAKGLLVVITCNHCPYALAVWPRLIRLSIEIAKAGVNTVGINPNIHPDYPEDSPKMMKDKIREWGIPFPYLVDESQEVAKALKAQCTPDPYLFDAGQKLVYHGRIDDNWKEEGKVKRHELKEAAENLVSGRPVAARQYPAMGCSIKWR